MAQFDVYKNPNRSAYPLLVDLQSDAVHAMPMRVVAPLTTRAKYKIAVVRLTPLVVVLEQDHVVLVPFIATVPVPILASPVGNLRAWRAELVAAIDLLFTGV